MRPRLGTVEIQALTLRSGGASTLCLSTIFPAGVDPKMTATAPLSQTQDQTIIEFNVRTDEMLVNMGPQHPSTQGVLRLGLRTDGEGISQGTRPLDCLPRRADKVRGKRTTI